MLSQVLLEALMILVGVTVAYRKRNHGLSDLRALRAFVVARWKKMQAAFSEELKRNRAYRPARRHAYTEDPHQWTMSGVTERFALELKEWNNADKEAEQSVAASLPERSAAPRRDPFYAALSRAGLAEGFAPSGGGYFPAYSSQVGADQEQPRELHAPDLCFSADDLVARLHGLDLQSA